MRGFTQRKIASECPQSNKGPQKGSNNMQKTAKEKHPGSTILYSKLQKNGIRKTRSFTFWRFLSKMFRLTIYRLQNLRLFQFINSLLGDWRTDLLSRRGSHTGYPSMIASSSSESEEVLEELEELELRMGSSSSLTGTRS